MKKILFVVDDNRMGGVSILLEDIFKLIDLYNKNVSLLILNKDGDRLNNISKNINVIYGTSFFKIVNIPLKEVKNIKQLFNKLYLVLLMKTGLIKYKIKKERKKILKDNYDIEISFKYGFTTLFTYYGDSKSKINWVQNDVTNDDPAYKYRSLFKNVLPLFNYNVVLSKGLEKSFNSIYNTNNTIVINNLVDINKINDLSSKSNYIKKDNINFIAIGRLSKTKGFDNLIECFKRLKDENILGNTSLFIIGDGEERSNLKTLVNDYNLNNNIYLLGAMDNPYTLLKEADMFILSSVCEGYGLVVVESLLVKTPVLSTRTVSIEEILDDRYGIITDDLYESIKYIIQNRDVIDEKRNNLASYSYDNDGIIQKIENILK